MFLLAVVALSLITVPLARGRLANLADARMHRTPLIFGALGIQVVIVSLVPDGHPALDRGLHLASYALAAAFLLANRHKPGMRIITVGALCNAVVIAANNGVLPASPAALRAAGQLTSTKGFVNSARLAHPRLLFLGDIFAIPKSWPLHNVFSVGDICIAIGAAVAIHALSGSRLFARLPRAKRLPSVSPAHRDEPTWSDQHPRTQHNAPEATVSDIVAVQPRCDGDSVRDAFGDLAMPAMSSQFFSMWVAGRDKP